MTKQIKTAITIILMVLLTNLSVAGSVDSLIKAIQMGNEELVISLIPGTDLNSPDKDGSTALTSAAGFYPGITKALLDAKADPNLATKTGISPLFSACRWGNVEAVRMLLAAGADVNKESQIGTALLASFYFPSAEITKMLLDAGAKFKDPVRIMNVLTVYPFLEFIKKIKTPAEMVDYYLGNKEAWLKLPVKFPDRVLNPKESDFSPAVEIVKLFLGKGLDINQAYETNKVKETALDAAMDAGLTEAAKILIDNGATFDPKKEIKVRDRSLGLFPDLTYTNGDYVLGAVLSNNLEFVKLMVEKNPKLISKSYEGTGNFKCSDGSGPKIVKYSVKGIDLLMIAAEHGNAEIVKFLIEKGAGRGKSAQAEWGAGYTKTLFCPMLLVRFTMAFAKKSGNQEVIELVKAAGHTKEE
ncbi:MAG: ankyrin repeat domain-containing protein [Lacibacter sp.]